MGEAGQPLFRTFDTGLPKLNELLMGGMPLGAMVQIFGVKGIGKSLLAFQLAYRYAAVEKRSVFYLDTELGFNNTVGPLWYGRFRDRFGVGVPIVGVGCERRALAPRDKRVEERELARVLKGALDELRLEYTEGQLKAAVATFSREYNLRAGGAGKPAILVLSMPDLKDILSIHGVGVDILTSEGGRTEVRSRPGSPSDVLLSPLGKLCAEHDVGLLVYDSISAPLKSTFSTTQDLPGRAAAMNFWFGQVQKLCAGLGCTALALNHASVDPVQGRVSFYGGGPVGFDFKFALQLGWVGKAPPEAINPEVAHLAEGANLRALWSWRFPARPDRSACVLLRLDDSGFNC